MERSGGGGRVYWWVTYAASRAKLLEGLRTGGRLCEKPAGDEGDVGCDTRAKAIGERFQPVWLAVLGACGGVHGPEGRG